MPARLNYDKGTLQFLLGVQRQDPFQFGMDGILARGRQAKIEDSRPTTLDEDESAEIAVTGNEDAALLVRDTKQFGIRSLSQTQLSHRYDVMAQAAEELDRDGINILVGQELHGVGARWMSSAATTSMAY